MLKWKHYRFDTISDTKSSSHDMLAGMSGKNRVIKHLTWAHNVNMLIRVYRDAEQIVEFDMARLATEAPPLPMDLPLAAGQLCTVECYNFSGADHTPYVMIGYEETG